MRMMSVPRLFRSHVGCLLAHRWLVIVMCLDAMARSPSIYFVHSPFSDLSILNVFAFRNDAKFSVHFQMMCASVEDFVYSEPVAYRVKRFVYRSRHMSRANIV